MDIAVIGSNMVDLVTYINRMPVEGETVEAPNFKLGCGGKGANQAVAAAKLGSEVLMLTRVGNDIFAENTIENFRRHNIDTRYILKSDASSGVAPIFVDPESRNSIIIIKGANKLLTAADIDAAAEDIKKCKLIVLQLEIPTETVYAAVKFGEEHGIPVLFNPAPAQPDLVLDQVKSCEFIVPNETELSLLTGMPVDSEDDIRKAAVALHQASVKNVIVTLGSKGVLWLDQDGKERMFPSFKVKARDTTGAGDAFIGCFSHVYVKTGDIAKAIETANRYAADSVTRLGTQTSYCDRSSFIADHPEQAQNV